MGALATDSTTSTDYSYVSASPSHTNAYLWPTVERVLTDNVRKGVPPKVFDLGCGNGSFAAKLSEQGINVTGVDPSSSGIEQANRQWPKLDLHIGSAYDDLRGRFGTFPALVSLEVVEHVYAPRDYAKCIADLLEPRGLAIISTPYHGYWKNLALALTGKLDRHFTALWDHGHIKFWSIRTLTHLLNEAGLQVEQVHRVGRLPTFAKSMILIARKPA